MILDLFCLLKHAGVIEMPIFCHLLVCILTFLAFSRIDGFSRISVFFSFMHLLQNSSDNRDVITFCDIRSL